MFSHNLVLMVTFEYNKGGVLINFIHLSNLRCSIDINFNKPDPCLSRYVMNIWCDFLAWPTPVCIEIHDGNSSILFYEVVDLRNSSRFNLWHRFVFEF